MEICDRPEQLKICDPQQDLEKLASECKDERPLPETKGNFMKLYRTGTTKLLSIGVVSRCFQ
jgi:hypothetical protein